MNKQELRNKYKNIRTLIDNKEVKSHLIFEKITNIPEYINSHTIALYNNFSTEVSTKELIEYSIKNNKEVYLPKITTNHKMAFHRINTINDITYKNNYGILEPNTSIILKENPDIIIVPGICFDKNKNRVGFGAGYYDTYLESHKTIKIGICFNEQYIKDDRIIPSPNDIPMDIIVTNDKIYR